MAGPVPQGRIAVGSRLGANLPSQHAHGNQLGLPRVVLELESDTAGRQS